MIFCNLARLLAIAAFVLGLLSVLQGIAMGFFDEAALVRYGGRSPGRAIDWGFYTILAAVALAEISFSMRKLSGPI